MVSPSSSSRARLPVGFTQGNGRTGRAIAEALRLVRSLAESSVHYIIVFAVLVSQVSDTGHGVIRGLPKTICTDNGMEFCGKAMVAWAHERGAQLRLIEPGKPNQNAYIESFNGRLSDECLNEHWFPSLLHARTEIERWRREYNGERPKRALGGLTPAAYAKQLKQASPPRTPHRKS